MNYAWIAFELYIDLLKYGKPEMQKPFWLALNGQDHGLHFWYGKSGRQKLKF